MAGRLTSICLPLASTVKLVLRSVEGSLAACAHIGALLKMIIPSTLLNSHTTRLGGFLTKHLVLSGTEDILPFFIALDLAESRLGRQVSGRVGLGTTTEHAE